MDFVKLVYDGCHYRYNGGSGLKMDILGRFLLSEIRWDITTYREWACDEAYLSACGNITSLDKEGGYIYLSDLYSEEQVPTELKMTVQQFIQLLDDWQDKVCKLKPKEVIIKYENDKFVIETN